MMKRNKVLAISTTVLILVLSFLYAPPLPSAGYDEFAASQKGLEIIGCIVHSSPHENTNVVLLKNIQTKQTFAKQIGSALILDESYSVTAIQNDYIELQGSRGKLRLYKFGFAPVAIAKAKVQEIKVPTTITGSYKEEGFEREEGNIKITEEYRKKILEKDLPKILMQAAAEPKMDANGNILGFALYDIEKDSVYAKAGLSDGDVIKSINGEELNSAQGAIKLLNSLKNANGMNIIIERGGQSLPLNLDVK